MSAAVYLCVHIPEFPAQAMLRLRPASRGQAVAVLDGQAPFEAVCSLNGPARNKGVKQGMTRAELDSFPGLVVLNRSPAEERAAKAAVLEVCGIFTPRMEDHSAGAACVIVLDASGTERLFGPVDTVAKKAVAMVRRLGLAVRATVSANLHAAVCLARWTNRTITCVPQGEAAKGLADLPLSALELTEAQTETFAMWGLRTLGEFAALPEVEVIVRLGQEGKRLRQLARGEAPHLMVPIEAAFALEEVMDFDAPVEEMHALLFVLGPMVAQLIERAGNRALALASVTVRLTLDGGGEHQRTIKPALPTSDRVLLLKLLHLDLVAHPPSAGVHTLRVAAEAGGRSKVQIGLFTPQMPEPMQLEVTLARIAALVGQERVGRVRLTDSHAPESFVMERFTVPARERAKGEVATKNSVAVRRMRPVIPVKVRHKEGSLVAFHMHGTRFQVQELYGPWRRSGSWWSGEVWSRDEWDVAAQAGDGTRLLCLLTHDLLRDRWQMEALYD